VPLSVALRGRDGGAKAELGDEVAGCLRASGGGGDKAHILAPIAFDTRQDPVSSTSVFGALGSSSPQAQAVCFAENSRGEIRLEGGDGQRTGALSTGGGKPGQGMPVVCVTGEVAHTLKAEDFDASEDGTGRGQPIINTTGALCAHTYSGGMGGRVDMAVQGYAIPSAMAVRRLTPRECERLQSFPDFYTLIPMSKVKASRAETMLVRGEPVIEIDGQWWKLSADGPRYKSLGNSMCVYKMRWLGRRIHFALTGSWPACGNFTHEREMGLVAA